MFSYTVMLIDLIDPVEFIYSGQHGQHSQQPCADRSAGKISVTLPANAKTLATNRASLVPTSAFGWENLFARESLSDCGKCVGPKRYFKQ
jgi:hypothetical protein